MRMTLLSVLLIVAVRTIAVENSIMQTVTPVDNSWRPFVLNWQDSEPTVWDFSRYIEAPAGKYGFLKVKGPYFMAGSHRIRLWGTNLSGPACFPTHEEAIKAARFLRRWGFNAVRLSHLDATWANGLIDYSNNQKLTFNNERFDRFFFFLAELKKNGIYYVIDGRHDFEFKTDEFKNLNDLWRRNGSTLPLSFYPPMQRHHEQYLTHLFKTKNPYTGVILADDTALAGVQFINETFLDKSIARVKTLADLPESFRAEFQANWQTWAASRGLHGDYDSTTSPELRRRFFSWLERRNFQRLYKLYRQDLGIKSPLATTSCYVGAVTLPSATDGDYTEGHAYFSHPHSEEVEYKQQKLKLSRLENQPGYIDNNYHKWLPFMLHQRIGYQPYVVGEWNNCLPERFDGPLLMAAFADVQDFDGIFLFTLAQSSWDKIATRNIGPFVSIGNPSIMINMIPAALAWYGRMIPAAREEIAVTASDATLFGVNNTTSGSDSARTKIMDAEGKAVTVAGEKYRTTIFAENLWLFRLYNCPEVTGIKMPPGTVKRINFTADTRKEFSHQRQQASAEMPITFANGLVTVNTPQWISTWGRLGGKTVKVGPLGVNAESSDFSVTATALDGRPLAASLRILITIGPIGVPRELVMLEKIDSINGRRLARWQMNKTEKEPMAAPIKAELSWIGTGLHCYKVSPGGIKGAAVAVKKTANGISWPLDIENPSWFYLLEH